MLVDTALELHLEALEQLYDSTPTDGVTVCLRCFMLSTECSCEISEHWPIELALNKIRLALGYNIA